VHAALVGRPRQIARLSAVLTSPIVGRLIASTWAIYWNNLADGAATAPAVTAAKGVHHLGRVATSPSRLRRSMRHDLDDELWRFAETGSGR
jgi:hypothetical protein